MKADTPLDSAPSNMAACIFESHNPYCLSSPIDSPLQMPVSSYATRVLWLWGKDEVKYNKTHHRLALCLSVILLFKERGLKQLRLGEKHVINDHQMLLTKKDSKATW